VLQKIGFDRVHVKSRPYAAVSHRRVLEELPETMDETNERILQEIPRASTLQCLTVAFRPLRLQELVEVLAVDFSAAEGIPKLGCSRSTTPQLSPIIS
jgi:hypothetical protein